MFGEQQLDSQTRKWLSVTISIMTIMRRSIYDVPIFETSRENKSKGTWPSDAAMSSIDYSKPWDCARPAYHSSLANKRFGYAIKYTPRWTHMTRAKLDKPSRAVACTQTVSGYLRNDQAEKGKIGKVKSPKILKKDPHANTQESLGKKIPSQRKAELDWEPRRHGW